MKAFFETDAGWDNLILRVFLGAVIFPHGAQKLLGWFGGFGYEGTMGFFTERMGMPAIVAILVILGESLGALGLIVGLCTRFCAFGVAAIMAGAIVMVHLNNGFFMNWSGKLPGEGYEYHLLAIAAAIPLMLNGGGKYSLDDMIVNMGFKTA